MRRLLTVFAAVALVFGLAGCSGPEDAELRYLEAPEGGVREYFPSSGARTPLFVGMTYGQAMSAANKADLTVGEEDGADQSRNPSYDGWTVVAQDPAAGVSTGRPWVRLTVLPNDEAEPVLASLGGDPHLEESRFTGTVTGYGDDPLAEDLVQVDGATVQLDLITPISETCDPGVPGEQARAAKERLIPVGAEVLVVMSERGDDRAFLHPWPTDVEPPLASLNEMLVRSSWWEPSGYGIKGGFDVYDPNVASAPYTVQDSGPAADDVRGRYAPLIAAAGSEGLALRAGGYGICQAIADGDVASFQAYKEETDRQIAAWEAEYQRRLAAGYYNCIDGDGDGICYER